MAYQSLAFVIDPLSLLTWTGPKVLLLALDPTPFEVSPIVTAFDSAITVPEIEPVLIWTLNLSVPSDVKSSAKVIVKEITKELIKLDSKNSSIYKSNSKKALADIDKLMKSIRKDLNKDLRFVVFHDA